MATTITGRLAIGLLAAVFVLAQPGATCAVSCLFGSGPHHDYGSHDGHSDGPLCHEVALTDGAHCATVALSAALLSLESPSVVVVTANLGDDLQVATTPYSPTRDLEEPPPRTLA